MTDEKSKTPVATEEIDIVEARQAFAAKLREYREDAGFSIEELSYATKILTQFIISLEEGEFERLPGDVFVRGFVKSICHTLGKPTAELLPLIDAGYGRKRTEKLLVVNGSPGASRVRIGSERPDRRIRIEALTDAFNLITPKSWGIIGAVGLAVALVVGAGFQIRRWAASSQKEIAASSQPVKLIPAQSEKAGTALQNENPQENQVADANANSTAGGAEEEAPMQITVPPSSGASAEAVLPTQPSLENDGAKNTAALVTTDEPQVIEMRVKEAVNIRINVDGRGWETSRYEPETYKIKFEKDVQMLVFDAAAVEVFFNQKSIGNLGTKGRIRRLQFVNNTQGLEKTRTF